MIPCLFRVILTKQLHNKRVEAVQKVPVQMMMNWVMKQRENQTLTTQTPLDNNGESIAEIRVPHQK